MSRKYIHPILAFTFLSFLLIISFFVANRREAANQDDRIENGSFLSYISASGIVEPSSGNVIISCPFDRAIEKICVSVNDRIRKGEILFQLYNQDLRATLQIKRKQFEESCSYLNKLMSLPRREDLAIAQENLSRAEAVYNKSVAEYWLSVRCDPSPEQKRFYLYRYHQAVFEFQEAKAQYNKVAAGAWMPEILIAQAEVEQARAAIEAMEVEIERTCIRSPLDGTVLQVKIHEGEFSDQVAIVLGNTDKLNLRVGIDQFNKLKFQPNGCAVAFKLGDNSTEFPLKFIYLEPIMVPKKYLTNELQERVDTQVFEILYRIEENSSHLFVGEQMDVYIYVDKNTPPPR